MAFLDYSGLQRFKSKLDALFDGKLNTSLKGAANGLAELDSAGKVPSSQLPSFVDDVLEYASLGNFPLTGESGKIYVALDTNKIYRWSGSAYVEISSSLALGETSATAYRGDRGKAAYDHATAKGSAFTSGLYKITTNAQGHVTGATAVAKSDITGLGIPGSDTNTHRPIQVNGTEVLGNNTTALNLKAGSNVSVTNSSGTVTISATDTTYSSKTASSGGTDVSLVTTGEKYTWNNKASSDTKNTTGTTNKTGTKMFIAAATEQSANPTTYSNSNVYIGTDNCLYSGGAKVLTAHQNISGKKNTQSAVSDPSASGTSVTFIATLSQNAQGVISPTKKTVRTMSGASSSAAGSTGLVPAPAAGAQGKFLKGDGTWGDGLGPNDIVNNLTTDDTTKALSAAMGKELNTKTASYEFTTEYSSLLAMINDQVTTKGKKLPFSFVKVQGGSLTDVPSGWESNELTGIVDGNGVRLNVTIHRYGATGSEYTRDIFIGNWLTQWHSVELASVENGLAYMETGSKASRNISDGEYVFWNGAMYKANGNIASGTTLISGRNLTPTENALNALNSKLQGTVLRESTASVSSGSVDITGYKRILIQAMTSTSIPSITDTTILNTGNTYNYQIRTFGTNTYRTITVSATTLSWSGNSDGSQEICLPYRIIGYKY